MLSAPYLGAPPAHAQRPRHSPTAGLELLAHGASVARPGSSSMRQASSPEVSDDDDDESNPTTGEAGPSAIASAHAGGSARPPRPWPRAGEGQTKRRITRACDRCNAARTKCNGQNPCMTCIESAKPCAYNRPPKKRGKVSAKERRNAEARQQQQQQQQQHQHQHQHQHQQHFGEISNGESDMTVLRPGAAPFAHPSPSQTTRLHPQHHLQPLQGGHPPDPAHRPPVVAAAAPALTPAEGYGFGDVKAGFYPISPSGRYSQYGDAGNPTPGFPASGQHDYAIPDLNRLNHYTGHDGSVRLGPGSPSGDAHVADWTHSIPIGRSPSRFSLPSIPSPGHHFFSNLMPNDRPAPADLKYPVLKPLVHRLAPIIPISLANTLLESYFTSSTSAFLHPSSSYIIAYVFRKKSFLAQHNPRRCSPALLCSMLWVAAQASDASYLNSSPAAKGKVCQKLLELTLDLLRPLVHHSNSGEDPSITVINGVALGGFGVDMDLPLPGGRHASEVGHYHHQLSGGEVDDIVTYIHLATVISASEYKAASMRWWSVVYSLVREFHFGKELPPTQAASPDGSGLGSPPDIPNVSEETREERRRVWWLAYSVDKHLALCYNSQLTLRDHECQELLRPVTEKEWQDPETFTGSKVPDALRPRGVGYEMTDHGIFGFFTPLMAILGECIDLQQMRMRLTPGMFDTRTVTNPYVVQAQTHLNIYAQSVAEFKMVHLPGAPQDGMLPATTAIGSIREETTQTIVAMAYASHVLHVLRGLLYGKWDPLSMFDVNDQWMGTNEFATATGHATEAAEALAPILECDPDLSFMPWFFGIYLLQGSFLFLLFTESLGEEMDERYVIACERIVRAIEACVVTLNTEYQRNFRKVMRSALAVARGRVPTDPEEAQIRRREVLSMYRWTPSGTGLAL